MPTGKLIKLIHLSQQTHAPSTRLVADHDDKGYGILRDAEGRDVYFAHQVVAGLRRLDDLRRGQRTTAFKSAP